MEAIGKQVTISEIARRANTSIATVSRVLNDSDYPVSEELRVAVLKAVEELKYVPNAFGKSLKCGKSNEIGVIVPNFSNPFYVQMTSGIESVLRQAGYSPLYFNSNNNSDAEVIGIETLRRKRVEGLILSSINANPAQTLETLALHENVVLFDQETSLKKCDYVSFNFEEAGYQAIRYLLENGHRHTAFLTAPLEQRASRTALYKGCIHAIEEWGSDARCELICSSVEWEKSTTWEYENGRNMVSMLLTMEERPTGLFVYNDMTAFSVISQLNTEGIRVPEEISVIGFDNIDMSEYTSPPLTTIAQPAFETGEMAARIILDRIQGVRRANCRVKFEPTIIERKSVRNMNTGIGKETDRENEGN